MKKTTAVIVAAIAAFLSIAPLFAQGDNPLTNGGYEVAYRDVPSYRDFRLAVGGGYTYRLGKVEKTGDSAIDNLNKKLCNGFNIDADAQYFFKESWGLGLNVNYSTSSTAGSNIKLPEVDQAGTYEERQGMLFVGPSFVARNGYSRLLLISSVGAGPLFYTDNITFNGVNRIGSKTTFGMNAGIAGEYKVSAKTGVGLKISYTLGTINSLNFEGQKFETKQGMSVTSLRATLFLSFRSW